MPLSQITNNSPWPCHYGSEKVDIPNNNLFCPNKIAQSAQAVFEKGQFTVSVNQRLVTIKNENVRGLPHNLNNAIQLKSYLTAGYFTLGKLGEEYTLTAKLRLLGGEGYKHKLQQAKAEYTRKKSEMSRLARNTGWTPETLESALRNLRSKIRHRFGIDPNHTIG